MKFPTKLEIKFVRLQMIFHLTPNKFVVSDNGNNTAGGNYDEFRKKQLVCRGMVARLW